MPHPQCFVVPIKAVTPVWTGNNERKTTYIKATSILGGLRFWTEGLVRSLGEEVCDINSEGNRDSFDPDGPGEICRVCSFFGCTGRGRGFRLSIHGENLQPYPLGRIELKSRTYTMVNQITGQTRKKTPTWRHYADKGLQGDMELGLFPLRPDGITPELTLALVLMLKWGTLGARDQFGYGGIEASLPQNLLDYAEEALPTREPRAVTGVSLKDFFFFQAQTENPYKELPFEVRFDVRKGLSVVPKDSTLRHYFCGSIRENDKAATKYNMALLPGGRLRGWGYFPRDGTFSSQRDRCLDLLKNIMMGHPNIKSVSWREFESPRDTLKQNTRWYEFLEELFKGGW